MQKCIRVNIYGHGFPEARSDYITGCVHVQIAAIRWYVCNFKHQWKLTFCITKSKFLIKASCCSKHLLCTHWVWTLPIYSSLLLLGNMYEAGMRPRCALLAHPSDSLLYHTCSFFGPVVLGTWKSLMTFSRDKQHWSEEMQPREYIEHPMWSTGHCFVLSASNTGKKQMYILFCWYIQSSMCILNF